jgi:hypothetical protein
MVKIVDGKGGRGEAVFHMFHGAGNTENISGL